MRENESNWDEMAGKTHNTLQKLPKIGAIRSHHVIMTSAAFGLLPAVYGTWAVILTDDCRPHKFFEHHRGMKLTVAETNVMFRNLLKTIQRNYSGRITAVISENFLCELSRLHHRKHWKIDVIVWHEHLQKLQIFLNFKTKQ